MDSCTRWHYWQQTSRLGGQAGLHPSSDIGSHRFINSKGWEEFHARYIRDLHSATHRTLTGETNLLAHWRFGWTRSQCITVAQLRTGHSPLLASYLHRIGRQQSPMCPHCGGDDETVQYLLLCCLSHTQARSSTSYINSTDPRHVVLSGVDRGCDSPSPRPGMRERERERRTTNDLNSHCLNSASRMHSRCR